MFWFVCPVTYLYDINSDSWINVSEWAQNDRTVHVGIGLLRLLFGH
jgi:hypothetical protein